MFSLGRAVSHIYSTAQIYCLVGLYRQMSSIHIYTHFPYKRQYRDSLEYNLDAISTLYL
mgnify:CR=1 FL=1